METLEQILIISHVAAGVISLIAGIMAAFVGKKGGKLHRQVGATFYWSMFWIFISALLIISFVRFSGFLLVIAVFSYYLAFSGVRTLAIKKTQKAARIDWVAGVVTWAFGIALMGFGLFSMIATGSFGALELLSLFFGFFTTRTAHVNLRLFKRLEQQEKMWWWLGHMNAMCGSLIASITAFLVQNGRIFGLPDQMAWVPWVLPALAGMPLMSYWTKKYSKQFKMGKYATA